MTAPVDPPFGHNGGPPLVDPVTRERGLCKHCRHWAPPADGEQRAYDYFRLGLSRRRVKRPCGTCDRVLMAPGRPTSFSATTAEFGCFNFSARPAAPPSRTGGGFVTIHEAGRILWQGPEEQMPARFRQAELDLPPGGGARGEAGSE